MTIPENLKVTDFDLYKGAFIFLLIDIVFITILVKRIRRDDFINMKGTLPVVMFVFFFLLFGIIASMIFWDSAYSYVFPGWSRWIVPPFYGLLFSLVGLLCRWAAIRIPLNPVLGFCIFGGLWGIVSHALAVQRGILDKPPMLQGCTPVAAMTIAAFEFVFYWCVCLVLTNMMVRLRSKFRAG